MVAFRIAGLVAVVLFTGGCPTVPTVPQPSSPDTTPAALRMGSAGLHNDITLDETATVAQVRRALRADEVVLVATARDPESGVRRVTLDISLSKVCGAVASVQNFSEQVDAPAGNGFPIELSKSYVFKPLQYRTGCSSTPVSVSISVVASAQNGSGATTTLQAARISSFGPDRVRVATFNLANPGNHADAVFTRWGSTLGAKADILLLQEVPDRRRAELLASAANMPYVALMQDAYYANVAIASRTPLYDIQRKVISPPGKLDSKDSDMLFARTDMAGFPIHVVAAHWGIRDAGDVEMPANVSSPSRLLAAKAIANLVPASAVVAFIGGDLNAYSGHGPQDDDNKWETPDFVGSTAEVDFLMARFQDAFIDPALPNALHCSNQRIDYVMRRGPYIPMSYESCFSDHQPSDHRFVLVEFVASDR